MIRDKMAPTAAASGRDIQGRSEIARSTVACCGLLSGLLAFGCVETAGATSEPDPDLVFVRGYRFESDACKLTGENAFTINFLDDAADLVTCPTGHPAALSLVTETDATIVTQTTSFTLYSVPRR